MYNYKYTLYIENIFTFSSWLVKNHTKSRIGQILVKLLNLKYPPETPPPPPKKVFMSLYCLDHKKKFEQ